MLISRRDFSVLTGTALASVAMTSACDAATFVGQGTSAQLKSRPKPGTKTTARGRSPLGLGGTRDGLLAMPATIPAGPMPLLVLMHGAGGNSANQLGRFASIPDEAGVAVLSVDSRGSSWDAIRVGFGPDVAFIDAALKKVFGQVAVDPARLAVGGFSDGATYALSLGLANGNLFRRIVAWSPGFIVDAPPTGKPSVFISHGTRDEILPIDRCSRVIVPVLKQRGYAVTYREFEGPHAAPPEVAREGFTFVAKA